MTISNVKRYDFYQVHENVVKAVNDKMSDEDKPHDLTEVSRVFGDSTRIKILYVLSEAEMCVCDTTQLLSMNQSAVPHQLRILKQDHLVKNRRDGKVVFYSLADSHMRTITNQGMEYMEEQTLRQIPMARGWDMEYK